MKKLFPPSDSPSYRLVREIALQNWPLILINISTNLLSVVLEGSTLGLIYLAIHYLSQGQEASISSPQLAWLKSLIPGTSAHLFIGLILGTVVLQGLLSLSKYSNQVSAALISAKAQSAVTGTIFERIMAFSYRCVSGYKVGDLVMYANDAAIAVNLQIFTINAMAVGVSFSLIYLLIIVRLSPVLAIAAGGITFVIAGVQYALLPRLRRVARRVVAVQVEAAKYLTESIQALRLLHTFGTQNRSINQAKSLLAHTQHQLQKRAYLFYLPTLIADIIPVVALAVLAISAVLLQESQTALLPMLLTFLLALQRLSVRLKATANALNQFADNSARMQRLDTILTLKDKEFEQSGTCSFPGLMGDIEFENVSLSYTQQENWALKDLNFTLPRHRVTALVGESGAGKSSVVDLLVGLYRPTGGHIWVNGQNLSDYDLTTWRQRIGIVSQDMFVFNDSILENIRYGRPTASLDDVIQAAKLAHAHGFILDLPHDYETVVGERGYRLSGGQRQRLALARALVKEPEILVLDEATSALDSESEKLIQQALEEFQRNRTVVVVAHRLSTIAAADQILVLDRGQVVEVGTHETLLRQAGRYARYWRLQSQAMSV